MCLYGTFRDRNIVFPRTENDERKNRRLRCRCTGIKARLANCALGFKYFDVPEIWPRVLPDVAPTSYANIYDRLSLANLLEFGCLPSLRALWGKSIFSVLK